MAVDHSHSMLGQPDNLEMTLVAVLLEIQVAVDQAQEVAKDAAVVEVDVQEEAPSLDRLDLDLP